MSAEMPDPAPENIDGAKTVSYSHKIHHKVNWGYVVLGLGLIALVLLAYSWYGEDDEEGAGGGRVVVD